MKGNVVEQSAFERAEEGDKDKKKKRRSNRRSKQNCPASGSASNPVNGLRGEATECLHGVSLPNFVTSSLSCSSTKPNGLGINDPNKHGLDEISKVAFNSLPTMHLNQQFEPGAVKAMQDQLPSGTYPKSCPVAVASEESIQSFMANEIIPSHQKVDAEGKIFAPHWPMEAVSNALEKGDAFRAVFRVNAHNRLEAYCTIDGVKTDILISGIAAQNRAVEGDVVAIQVDPLSLWTRMKGSNGPLNNSDLMEEYGLLPEVTENFNDSCKGKNKIDADNEIISPGNCSTLPEKDICYRDGSFSGETVHTDLMGSSSSYDENGQSNYSANLSHLSYLNEQNEAMDAVAKICAAISSFPFKRPTGKVIAIIESSPRRDAVVGFLSVRKWLSYREGCKRDLKKNKSSFSFSSCEFIQLTPTDPKFPKMNVPMEGLPDCLRKRLEDGDKTVDLELIGAQIDNWEEESLVPQAQVMCIFGRGGELEAHIAAILFENAICSSEFSTESISCLPLAPWEVPPKELSSRRDLRNLCIFTIDPCTATDLDDALSVERLSNGIFRVGVHIADVSYFVQPDTALDKEAQIRSTSVYIVQHKIPMLPQLLSENLGSLIPGVDRLAFSIFWDFNPAGDVVDRWIGRTVVRSCCKLSYEHAQDIIDGVLDVKRLKTLGDGFLKLHGSFDWLDVIQSVKFLYEFSKTLKANRFNVGALRLESPKVVFLFDENGIPNDSMLSEQDNSNYLVEEFMLLANRTAAEVISRAFPDSALLRRHPEPDSRKLREFEAFCRKHGLELDTSSSGQLHNSLERIRENLKNDSVMFDILMSYASRPMQLAKYFCSGGLGEGENNWGHYALAVPIYTHFTSPLRRYPDIVVHRTLVAAIEAEDVYLKNKRSLQYMNKRDEMKRCFTGMYFDKDAAESVVGQEALSAAALKHRVPCTDILADVVAHCNNRALASKHTKDACDRLYMWVLLKKKEILLSEARILGLGPKFMSIYIHKLAIERRIYYDEVDGLMVEWLDATSTLVLSFSTNKRFYRRGSPGKCKALEDVALVVRPANMEPEIGISKNCNGEGDVAHIGLDAALVCQDHKPIAKCVNSDVIGPAVFPLTVRLLSTIPVALHAVGGTNGPLDIGARLFIGSYLGNLGFLK